MYICHICLNSLTKAYEFRVQCKSSTSFMQKQQMQLTFKSEILKMPAIKIEYIMETENEENLLSTKYQFDHKSVKPEVYVTGHSVDCLVDVDYNNELKSFTGSKKFKVENSEDYTNILTVDESSININCLSEHEPKKDLSDQENCTAEEKCFKESPIATEVIQCDICEQQFDQHDLFINHMIQAHSSNLDQQIQYSCSVCSSMYPYEPLLNHHMLYKHNKRNIIKRE